MMNWTTELKLVESQLHKYREQMESIPVSLEFLQLSDLGQLNTSQIKK